MKIVLARGGAHEEARQHTLADVHRIKLLSQGRIGQMCPHGDTNCRLIPPHQLKRRLRLPAPHAKQKLVELIVVGHRPEAPSFKTRITALSIPWVLAKSRSMPKVPTCGVTGHHG